MHWTTCTPTSASGVHWPHFVDKLTGLVIRAAARCHVNCDGGGCAAAEPVPGATCCAGNTHPHLCPTMQRYEPWCVHSKFKAQLKDPVEKHQVGPVVLLSSIASCPSVEAVLQRVQTCKPWGKPVHGTQIAACFACQEAITPRLCHVLLQLRPAVTCRPACQLLRPRAGCQCALRSSLPLRRALWVRLRSSGCRWCCRCGQPDARL